ncbi:MAG: PEGA domain-containing protein [Acidobacteria bacterium]|nr:PEGA domain-containing protein [Acidobacteriota bacterium]
MHRQVLVAAVVAVGFILGVYAYFTQDPAPAPVPVERAAPPRDAPAPVAESPDLVPSTIAPARPAARTPAKAAPAVTAPPEPPAPTTATLHITSDVPGAQVFIDRKFIGVAPVTAGDVAPGSRQINVFAPGYEGVAETLDVSPGSRDVMISLKTIRLDQSVAAIHKHRIGSCTGRLIATPDGLRYETGNKDDGFVVPLTGLETFSVDYAAKALKVKVKGGRTYDFTDQGGKAEPLYFFHQAVDKVRQRLAGGGL